MRYDFKSHLNPVFIETGSLQGKGIQAARDARFGKIISIELSRLFYDYCVKKFTGDTRVSLYHGDSAKLLPDILADIDERCTFWLDAHYSGDKTAPGVIPLMAELLAIKDHHIKDHTIIIDDMRLIRTHAEQWGDFPFSAKDIEGVLHSINKDYNIHYEYGVAENDILIAEI